jgi:3-oxoacyl-[acyl-carrier protein] reductase
MLNTTSVSVEMALSVIGDAGLAYFEALSSICKRAIWSKGASADILGASGIRVNAVAPGAIDTDMSNLMKTDAGREAVLGMQALKRLGKPEDVADVVAFVASDAARWITGASIPVDGGSKL